MSGWDEGAVFYRDQAQFPQGDPAAADITRHSALRKFKEFLRGFTGPTGDFPYRVMVSELQVDGRLEDDLEIAKA